MYAGGGAGLETAKGDASLAERVGKKFGRQNGVGAAFIADGADVDAAVQISPAGDDDSLGAVLGAEACAHTADTSILKEDSGDLVLLDTETLTLFECLFHTDVIPYSVGLNAEAVDGGALAAVQDTALQKSSIGGLAHFAAQSIYLADEVTFSGAADRGVTGHIGNAVEAYGEDRCFHTEAGGGEGGLAAGVTGTDDNDVIDFGKIERHKQDPLQIE